MPKDRWCNCPIRMLSMPPGIRAYKNDTCSEFEYVSPLIGVIDV